MSRVTKHLSIVMGLIALLAGPAQAGITMSFTQITNNSSNNVGGQLFVDMAAVGSSQMSFHFRNMGSDASSITQIYWENTNSVLDSISGITDSGSGVSFGTQNNGNFPGGNSLTPQFDEQFIIKANSPVSPNGVNPSEWVEVLFNLSNSINYNTVEASLKNQSLRIGLHVQSIVPTGNSNSYIAEYVPVVPPTVPVPGAVILGSLGMGLVGLLRRRNTL